jgi:hypothetical protein
MIVVIQPTECYLRRGFSLLVWDKWLHLMDLGRLSDVRTGIYPCLQVVVLIGLVVYFAQSGFEHNYPTG